MNQEIEKQLSEIEQCGRAFQEAIESGCEDSMENCVMQFGKIEQRNGERGEIDLNVKKALREGWEEGAMQAFCFENLMAVKWLLIRAPEVWRKDLWDLETLIHLPRMWWVEPGEEEKVERKGLEWLLWSEEMESQRAQKSHETKQELQWRVTVSFFEALKIIGDHETMRWFLLHPKVLSQKNRIDWRGNGWKDYCYSSENWSEAMMLLWLEDEELKRNGYELIDSKEKREILKVASQDGKISVMQAILNKEGWNQKGEVKTIEEAWACACRAKNERSVEYWIETWNIKETEAVKKCVEGWDWAQERLKVRRERLEFGRLLEEESEELQGKAIRVRKRI